MESWLSLRQTLGGFMIQKSRARRCTNVRGLAALEFAIVFPVFFLMMYGMLSYALIFAAQHTLAHSAAEGARAALRFNGTEGNKDLSAIAADRVTAACEVVAQATAWLQMFSGESAKCEINKGSSSCHLAPSSGNVQCFSVSATYNYADKPLIPKFPLLPVPALLTGKASTQIALRY
jgi:Flp pilus assembly protein TadG